MADEASQRGEIRFEVKGTIVRSLVGVLQRRGQFAAVLPRVTDATRQVITALPPASAWIPGTIAADLNVAIAEVHGVAVLRQVAYEASRDGLMPVLATVTQGILRVFGVSPASLLSRMNLLGGSTIRGVEYRYEPKSPTTGTLTVEYTQSRGVPTALFEATGSGLDSLLELCSVKGTISPPDRVDDGRANAARFNIAWQPLTSAGR